MVEFHSERSPSWTRGPARPTPTSAAEFEAVRKVSADHSFAALLRQTATLAEERAGGTTSGSAGESDRFQALKEVTEEIESLFLHEMISRMRATIFEGGLFAKSFARESYENMLSERWAAGMADAGGIGLAELLYRQLAPHVREES